jgi:transcriptional regulator with XRE-family HTH domain
MLGKNFWGEQIRTLRDEIGISQRQLAKLAKVNRSTLRRIEAGEARGDIEVIERLLELLGYEMDCHARESKLERLRRWAATMNDPVCRSHINAKILFLLGSDGYHCPSSLTME